MTNRSTRISHHSATLDAQSPEVDRLLPRTSTQEVLRRIHRKLNFFKLTGFVAIFSLVLSGNAFAFAGLDAVWVQAEQWVRSRTAPMYTQAPLRVQTTVGPNRIGRDPGRLLWWGEQALVDFQNILLDESLNRGEVWALMGPPTGGGGGPTGGSGAPGEGEISDDPADPDAAGTGSGSSPGIINTNTGNKLSTYRLTGWSSRGDSSVDFTVYHNSAQEGTGPYKFELGNGWSHTYDSRISESGQTAVVRMPDGLRVPYTILPNGTYSPPEGWFKRLVRHTDNSYTLTFRNQTRWNYDPNGFLIQVVDHSGNTVSITRNSSNKVTQVTCPSGRSLQFAYNQAGFIETVTDPLRREWTFRYDPSEDLTELDFPELDGQIYSRSFMYDSNSRIISATDRNGNTKSWTYNSDGTVASSTNALGRTATYTYGASSMTVTLPGSQTITHTYNNGLLIAETDQAGFTRSYTYTNRLVTKVTDERGNDWLLSYDANGNLTSRTDPLNRVWSYQYDSANNLTRAVHPDLAETSYTYDSHNRLTQVVNPLGNTVSQITYDSYGQPASSQDATGVMTLYSHDAHGNLTQVIAASGAQVTATYGVLGEPLTVTAAGSTTTIGYDGWMRVSSLTHPDSSQRTTQYDLEGNVLSVTDEIGRITTYAYDAAYNLVSLANPRGDTETYAYSPNNELVEVVNGRGKSRTYEYTPRGELFRLSLPDGAVEQWSYDGTGNVTLYTSPNSYQIAYSYDAAGQLSQVSYPTGAPTSFTYDLVGRTASMSDSTGATTWSYDAAGRLLQLIQPQGATEYTYDAAGRMLTMTEPAGTSTWSYDAYGRLQSLTNALGEVTGFSYDSFDRPVRRTLHSGVYDETAYDSRSRVVSVLTRDSAGRLVRGKIYTYNAASQIISENNSGAVTSYTYDLAGQLLSETRPGFTASYTYDANGNRLTRTIGGVTETYTYDDADKLLQVVFSTGGGKTYTYDAAGRTTSITTGAGVTSFTYDWESRITSISGPGGYSQTNVYNGLDTRVSKTVGALTRTYHRAGPMPTDPVLSDGANFYTPGISVSDGSETRFQHGGLKSFDAQSDSGELIQSERQYDAFGNLLSASGTRLGELGYGGAFGYQEDEGSGLRLLGHRYYDSSTGRFLTRDPIKDGRNWYVYCDSDPVSFADPDGYAKLYIGWRPVLGVGNHVFILIICEETGQAWTIGGGPKDGVLSDFSGPVGKGNYERLTDPNKVSTDNMILIVDDDKLGEEWYDNLSGHGKEIERERLPYKPLTQNSNSFLYTILGLSGLISNWENSGQSGKVSSNAWTMSPGGAIWAPGWSTRLPVRSPRDPRKRR